MGTFSLLFAADFLVDDALAIDWISCAGDRERFLLFGTAELSDTSPLIGVDGKALASDTGVGAKCNREAVDGPCTAPCASR